MTRIGTFKVTKLLVDECHPALRTVMGACIILQCMYDAATDCFIYLAISPQFEPVLNPRDIPAYDWQITAEEPLGFMSIKAVRAPRIVRVH